MRLVLFLSIFVGLCLFPHTSAFASTILELRPAVFIPSNNTFRDLYGTVEPSYQLEVTTKLPDRLKTLWFWSNVDQLYQSGKLKNHCGSSTISVTNFSLGLKSIGTLTPWSQIYVGVGPCFSMMLMGVHSCCLSENHLSKFYLGGSFKSGLYFTIKQRYLLDLFCDYFYLPTNLRNCRNIGGVKFGIGLGYKIR